MIEVPADGVVRSVSKQTDIAPRRRELKVSETNERRRDPTQNCSLFQIGIAVVEHVAHHLIAGENEAKSPCRRHTEMKHRLTA